MLTAGARAPESRFNGALIGFAVVLIFTVVFFALRRGEPDVPAAAPLASGSESARAARSELSTHGETEVPNAARAARKKAPARPTAAPEEEPALAPDDVSDPALKAVLAARADRSRKGTQTLIDNLTSSDEVVVAEAAKALVARRATEAIAPLAKISLEKAAGSGLSVVAALGKLGGAAEGDEKSAAVERLLQMLREEKRRRARESPGNLLQIYEALGDTRDPKAAPALEAELLDASVPRASKVVIVNALAAIGQTESRAALTTALAEQSSTVAADSLEEEIRQELVGVIEKALQTL